MRAPLDGYDARQTAGFHVPLSGTGACAPGSTAARGERDELLDAFLAASEWTRIYFGWRPNLSDEGDNHLVELAVAGGARYIVTRNLRDVGRMELRFPGLRALGPEDFLRELSP
jgi:predicted nucleic acid-binding protein